MEGVCWDSCTRNRSNPQVQTTMDLVILSPLAGRPPTGKEGLTIWDSFRVCQPRSGISQPNESSLSSICYSM